MRRLIIAGLVFILAINPATVYAGLWQLLVGMGLMGGGVFMTVDGFSTAKKIDKEWDEKVIDKEWYEVVKDKEWDFLYYEYHVDSFLYIWWDFLYPDPYPASVVSTWWSEDWSGYPADYNYYEWNHHITYKTEYYVTYRNEHFVTYKKETKSPTEGAVGIASTALGTYLVIDYLINLSRLKEKTGIEIKFAQQKDTSYFLCSKNF